MRKGLQWAAWLACWPLAALAVRPDDFTCQPGDDTGRVPGKAMARGRLQRPRMPGVLNRSRSRGEVGVEDRTLRLGAGTAAALGRARLDVDAQAALVAAAADGVVYVVDTESGLRVAGKVWLRMT